MRGALLGAGGFPAGSFSYRGVDGAGDSAAPAGADSAEQFPLGGRGVADECRNANRV